MVKNVFCFLVVFLIIFAVIVSALEVSLYRLGETLPYSEVQEKQNKEQVHFFPKYSNVDVPYKVLGIKQKKFDIIALGTSRIMTLGQRHLMGNTFYNAGVDASSVGGLNGMTSILQSLKDEEMPRIVVLSLDPWLFNPSYPPNQGSLKKRIQEKLLSQKILSKGYRAYKNIKTRLKVYDMLLREKENWLKFVLHPNDKDGIGLNAKVLKSGFWVDGSFQYPEDVKHDKQRTFTEWENILNKDQYRFAEAQELDKSVIEEFMEFLRFCKSKNLVVVGFLMPFREDFYDALTRVNSQSQYLRIFREKVPELMKSYGYPCYDLTSPGTMKLNNEHFIDNNHVTQTVHFRTNKFILKGARRQNAVIY